MWYTDGIPTFLIKLYFFGYKYSSSYDIKSNSHSKIKIYLYY